jgi:hypothetical protein
MFIERRDHVDESLCWPELTNLNQCAGQIYHFDARARDQQIYLGIN